MDYPVFRWSFWFNWQTEPFTSLAGYFLLALTLLCLAASVGIWVYRQNLRDKLLRKVAIRGFAMCLSAGLTGLLLYGFAWQRIPVLGMRVFWMIWALAHGVWAYAIWSTAHRAIPAQQKTLAQRAAYEKWLPKPKR